MEDFQSSYDHINYLSVDQEDSPSLFISTRYHLSVEIYLHELHYASETNKTIADPNNQMHISTDGVR